jgi:hypothetical protein
MDHKDADLDLPMSGQDTSTTILGYIVLKEQQILIQHPTVQERLWQLWSPKLEPEDTWMVIVKKLMKSRRGYFYLAALHFLVFLSLWTASKFSFRFS